MFLRWGIQILGNSAVYSGLYGKNSPSYDHSINIHFPYSLEKISLKHFSYPCVYTLQLTRKMKMSMAPTAAINEIKTSKKSENI